MATITTAIAGTATAGKLFPDGTAIEQISKGRLLFWQGAKAQISNSCTHVDCTYVPAAIDSNLEETLQLPDGKLEMSAPEELVADLSESFQDLGKLEACSARLMASYVVGTWVPESLPGVPVLNLYGPCGSEFSLLQMLSALVRRPLRLADCPLSELARLPEGLYPTLILASPKSQLLQKLLSGASTNSGWLRGGRLLRLGFPAIVCTSASIGAPALCLSLPPVVSQNSMTDSERQQLYKNFTSRLLAFRLAQHRVIATSPHHSLTFTPAGASLARILGATLAPARYFQQQVLADLQHLDELVKSDNSEGPAAIVLEALLAQVHEDRSTATIRETTDLVNAIYLGRGESVKLTTKKVGLILRQDLGFIARRAGPGYELQLDRATRTRIHQLGLEWAILSLQQPQPGCELCQALFPGPSSTPQQSNENTPAISDSQSPDNLHCEHNVHEDDAEDDIHNVQHVHDIQHELGLAACVDHVQNVHDICLGSAMPGHSDELPPANSSETITMDSSEQTRAGGDTSG